MSSLTSKKRKPQKSRTKCSPTATSSNPYSEGSDRETTNAQSPAERKLAEQLSHEDVTDEEWTALEMEIEHVPRLEPSKESELESSKESDTARVADVKIHRQSSRADNLPNVKPMFDELWDLDQECEKLEHSLTKLQEELETPSTNELEWKSQSIQTKILIARRVSQKSHGALVEVCNRLQKANVNSQLKKSEERAAQLKQDSTLNRALMRIKRKELTTFDVNTNEMRCDCQMKNSTERNTHTRKTRSQIRTKTKLRYKTSWANARSGT